MDFSYWQRQTKDKPLFPDLIWSRPESRQSSGKLLIIGGNLHSFAAVGEAYNEATKAGIGSIRLMLPDSLEKIVGKIINSAEFAPSTPSGSFSRQSTAAVLDAAAWADAILFCGDFGRNAETAILIENLLTKYAGLEIFTQDSADYISSTPQEAVHRKNTMLVLSLSQLQRMVINLKYTKAITFNMDLSRLVEWLHEFTSQYNVNLVTEHLGVFLAASEGKVSTTKLGTTEDIWRVKTASQTAVWWLQNSDKAFEAATSALATIEF